MMDAREVTVQVVPEYVEALRAEAGEANRRAEALASQNDTLRHQVTALRLTLGYVRGVMERQVHDQLMGVEAIEGLLREPPYPSRAPEWQDVAGPAARVLA